MVQKTQYYQYVCDFIQKNRYGRNFQNIASPTNERWLITQEKTLIYCGTDILKIVAVAVVLTPLIFANGSHLAALNQLRVTKTGSKLTRSLFLPKRRLVP